MAGGNGKEGAGVVVETRGVVDACTLRHLQHAAVLSWNHRAGPSSTQDSTPRAAQFSAVRRLIEHEYDHAEVARITVAIEQWLERAHVFGGGGDVCAAVSAEALGEQRHKTRHLR